MIFITRLLQRADPARDLADQLDDRARTELDELIGPSSVVLRPAPSPAVRRPRARLQPLLVTAVVTVGVVALSAVALADGASRQYVTANGAALPATGSAAASGTTHSGVIALIGPKRSRVLSRAELHDYVQRSFDDAGSTNARLWEEQQWLAMQCMTAAGYLFDPTLVRAPHQTPQADGLSASQQKAWQDALGGKGSRTPYNWRTDSDWRHAGCIGRAVHTTEQVQPQ